MDNQRKELAERKTRLQEIFDETRAFQDDYSPFSQEHASEARELAQADARDYVVNAFRRFHQKHHGRLRRKDLIDMFAKEASRMS